MIVHVCLGLSCSRVGLLEARVLVAILELVQRLFASIEFLEAAQVPRIDQQVLLDGQVQGTVG